MKRLSISLPILLFALMLSGAGVTHRKTETTNAPTQALFYWFTWPDDAYNDRKSISDESNEMWFYYGVFVNTNPAGGVLVDRGYTTNVYPHNVLPSVFLYAHY